MVILFAKPNNKLWYYWKITNIMKKVIMVILEDVQCSFCNFRWINPNEFQMCPKVSIRICVLCESLLKCQNILKILREVCILKGENPNYPRRISNFNVEKEILQILESSIFKKIHFSLILRIIILITNSTQILNFVKYYF